MRSYTAVIERCKETGYYVGYVPGLPGAHTQAESLDEAGAFVVEEIRAARGGDCKAPVLAQHI